MNIEEIKKEIQEKIDKDFNGEESWQFASGVMHVLNTYYTPLAESHRELVEIVERLRSGRGWDMEQTQTALSNAKKLINEKQ